MEPDSKQQMLVFIVDDDPLFSKALMLYLSREVPEVQMSSFPNGEACLHEMHRDPDLILLDFKLDSEFSYAWDGLQMLKRFKTLDPGIGVVILSSCESAEVAMECVSNGALEYIVKNDKTFSKVKDLLVGIEDEISIEDHVKLNPGQQTPQLIGLVLIIIFIIFLLFKL